MTPGETASRGHSESGPELGLAVLTLVWGVNFSVIKEALEVLEPMAFNALRFPLAALVLWALLRLRGPIPLPPREDLPRVLLLGILGNVAYQLLFIVGIDRTLAGNASLILATTPVWTLVLAAALGVERHGWPVWAGITTTLVGMVMVVTGGPAGIGTAAGPPMGDLLMAFAALTWAAYTVLGQDMTRKHGSLAVTSWTIWIGSVGLVVIGLPALSATDFGGMDPGVWFAVAYAGVLAIAVGYLLWYRGVEAIGSSRTAVYSNLVPVVALITAAVWLGERPGAIQMVGATVVIAGVWMAGSRRRRMRRLKAPI